MDLDSIRREYLQGGLRRKDLCADPHQQFEIWMTQAIELGMQDATAMTVATVSAGGQPSQRIVLLKQFDQQGLVFFTSYGSRKADEIANNSKVSLHFPWHCIERQIKICGAISKVATADSEAYFRSRPRESQLAALVSQQSQVIASRETLLEEYRRAEKRFDGTEVDMPESWGGYRIVPDEFEFWQGGAHRLHDRFRYRKLDGAWSIDRLAP